MVGLFLPVYFDFLCSERETWKRPGSGAQCKYPRVQEGPVKSPVRIKESDGTRWNKPQQRQKYISPEFALSIFAGFSLLKLIFVQ